MASLPSFPAMAAAVFLLLFLLPISLSLRTPVSLEDDNLKSPVSKPNPSPKKKPISELPEIKNKTKSLKPKKTNDSTTTISTSASTKLKLNKTLSSAATKFKLNITLNAAPIAVKSKLNKTSVAAALVSPVTYKTKLNKTTNALKTNATKLLKTMKLLKSNSTKTPQPKSPNPSPKSQKKKLETIDPHLSKTKPTSKQEPKASPANWLDETDAGDDADLISDFRELPSRFHSAFVPDLEKLSTTSKFYFSKTHREISAGFKPFVGQKYAPSIASAASVALVILPLLLVTAVFRYLLRTGSFASLHRALLFVQAYLAIYFATLSLTAVLAGREPLRFFYAASPAAYAWTQAVQTLGYVVYLIAQLIAMVVAFSAGESESSPAKAVGLAQMLLGLAVGLHYYITVFHQAVSGDAPRANWKVHGIYAASFVVICGLGRAVWRKKAYLQDDGVDNGKKS